MRVNNGIGIFGSSSQAREVADICLEIGFKNILFIDTKEGKDPITGIEIVSESNVNEYYEKYSFVIGVGDGTIRKKIYRKFNNLKFINIIHPSATFGRMQLNELQRHKGNIVGAGVRFSNNIKMGDFGLFNSNATIAHDCIIEDFVTISPGANIAGNVHLHEEAFIGIGATVIQGKSVHEKLHVGPNSIVGAGAVVIHNIAPNAIVKGIPAK